MAPHPSPRSTMIRIAACMLLLSISARAEIAVPDVFGDHMILQRDLPVVVWGSATTDESVTVSFAGQSKTTTTKTSGNWQVTLDPLKTSKIGRTLTISGSNTIQFKDVLVGEVWLCRGQSNMAGRFSASKDHKLAAEYFENDLSLLRTSNRTGWHPMTQSAQNLYSRVAFYFGYELLQELEIPVGLIQRYNSGTPIQSWMPKAASEEIRKKLGVATNWNDPKDKGNRAPGHQYADKTEPIVPFTFRGVIWYQGERNAKSQLGWEYDQLLAFHVKTWRELWATQAKQPARDFPFYYVQVPTQMAPLDAEWPWLRDRMRRALNLIPNSGMAVFYDYGPDLHPANKQPAGKRLSLLALRHTYDQKDVVANGPLLRSVKFEGATARISFDHTEGGLKSRHGQEVKYVELAGKDGVYHHANANLDGNTVVASSPAVPKPAFARYLFRKAKPDPDYSLHNGAGLPASSFITDDAKPPRQ